MRKNAGESDLRYRHKKCDKKSTPKFCNFLLPVIKSTFFLILLKRLCNPFPLQNIDYLNLNNLRKSEKTGN